MEVAAEAGFQVMDIDLERDAELRGGAVRRELDAAGLAAWASPLPIEMREDAATFERGFDRFRRLVDVAAEIGLRVMHRSLPASTDRDPDEFVQVLRERWSQCAAVTGAYGITLAVEPLGTLYRRRAGRHELLWRLPDAAAFARSCDGDVGLLVDSWHWQLAGGTRQEIVDAGDRIVHVHVADVPEAPPESLRDTERALPGSGTVDFEEFFAALDAAGYRGPASPEVPGTWSHGLAPAEAARRGLAATVAVMGSR